MYLNVSTETLTLVPALLVSGKASHGIQDGAESGTAADVAIKCTLNLCPAGSGILLQQAVRWR